MYHPQPKFLIMSMQSYFYDFDLPLERSKFVLCGNCPTPRPIARACGQHFALAHFNLSDFDSVGRWSGTEIDRDDNKSEKLKKHRGGIMYAVEKDKPRVNLKKFSAELAEIHPEISAAELPAFVEQHLGHRRSTKSKGHLALVRLNDFEPASELTCWNCGTTMSISRGNLAKAVDHALEHGGTIFVSTEGTEVRNSTIEFGRSTHLPSSKLPDVMFRRGSDFVAAGHVQP